MALKTFGNRFGKRFAEIKQGESFSWARTSTVDVTSPPSDLESGVIHLVIGTTQVDVQVVNSNEFYRSSGVRAAKLRAKVDQAIRESDEAREKAQGSGDMVVIVG